MAEFRMPSLGSDMEDGTVVEWLVAPGDRVQRGDVVAVVETTKGAIEIEIFEAGTIEQILVPAGTTVPVGEVLATYAGTGEPTAPAAPPAPGDRVKATPAARRRAGELGVDLAACTPTGPQGDVVLADVETAAGAGPAAGPGPRPAAGPPDMRAAIAAAMARSKREIPHYYLAADIDLKPAMDHLTRLNADLPMRERILPAAILYRATALALVEVPELNGHWADGEARLSEAVHLGIAISLKGSGLVAPAIHDAQDRSLTELSAALHDLIARARKARLKGSELADPTVTVTNLGERGADTVYGVIYPPQLAIIGFGRIAERPAAVAGALAVHPMVTATVAGDHRASDGFHGMRLLRHLERILAQPEDL